MPFSLSRRTARRPLKPRDRRKHYEGFHTLWVACPDDLYQVLRALQAQARDDGGPFLGLGLLMTNLLSEHPQVQEALAALATPDPDEEAPDAPHL